MSLRALPYYGGKSPIRGTARWIASMLPNRRIYVEPFAGMCGVLLLRKRSPIEVINDLDPNVASWWTAARDQNEELRTLLKYTPWNEKAYYDSVRRIRSEGPHSLERALATHIALEQGFIKSLGHGVSFLMELNKQTRNMDSIAPLEKRMKGVSILNRDALEVASRASRYKDCVMYLDPPYLTTDNTKYGRNKFDVVGLTNILRNCRCFAAIGGYGNDWDHLGWHKKERKTKLMAGDAQYVLRDGRRQERVEVLWLNRQPQTAIDAF